MADRMMRSTINQSRLTSVTYAGKLSIVLTETSTPFSSNLLTYSYRIFFMSCVIDNSVGSFFVKLSFNSERAAKSHAY
jgi:hypothetical protein